MQLGAITLRERNPERHWPPDLFEEIPTPLESDDPGTKAPIILAEVPPSSQHRSLWMLGQVAKFTAKGLWRSLAGSRPSAEERAILLRELFERLSGIWIKLGQLMSLRTDLMSEEMCRELSKLQFEVRGFPIDVAVKVLEEDLGKPISSVFSYFERHPFAAATVAQVHRATLLSNNRAVVVKIMRPDVSKSFERDLQLLQRFVSFTRTFGLFKRMRLGDAARELRDVLTEETNYEQEAVNLRKMRKSLRKHSIYVPRVISKLSSRRVLVMEEVPGVLMSQYIRVRRENPERADAWALQNGIDVEDVARHLAVSTLRQIVEDNLFHGDLHPGNILMLADNGLALIDFGSVGRLDRRLWTLYCDSLSALAMKDYDRFADLTLMMSPMLSRTNTKSLRRDMTIAMRKWELSGQYAGAKYSDRSIASMSEGVAKVMANHNVTVAWGIMRVGRTLSTLDASLQTLWPTADFAKLCREYFKDRRRRHSTPRGRRERMKALLMEVAGVAADAKLLLGSGLREQAMRIGGVMDSVTRLRMVIATWGERLTWWMLVIVSLGAYFDEGRDQLMVGGNWPGAGLLHVYELADAVPDIHPVQWALLALASVFLIRFFRAMKRSIAGD